MPELGGKRDRAGWISIPRSFYPRAISICPPNTAGCHRTTLALAQRDVFGAMRPGAGRRYISQPEHRQHDGNCPRKHRQPRRGEHLPGTVPRCYGHAAPVLSPRWQPPAGWDAVRGLTWGRALREPSTRLQTLVGASVLRAVTLTSRGGVPGVLQVATGSLRSPSSAGS